MACREETFREMRARYALAFMSAFAVNPALDPEIGAAHVASDAVEWADALIKALGEDS
jgi:hypothetical protein